MFILSIIVSCYNVEKYILDCIDSLYQQDIPENDYEVICVNDCSTDSTIDIIKKYQLKHKNLRLINHKQNLKLGATRNTGRENAKGKYVWFVDGDDMIKPNVLNGLLSICENECLDELLFNHERIYSTSKNIEYDLKYVNSDVLSGIEFVNKYFHDRLAEISIVWSQIYRNKYLVDNNFRSPEINMGEDAPFAWESILFAERVKSTCSSCYIYRCNSSSMTATFKQLPVPERLFEKTIRFGYEVMKLYSKMKNIDYQIAEDLKRNAIWSVNMFTPIFVNNFSFRDRSVFLDTCSSDKKIIKNVLPIANIYGKMILANVKFPFIVNIIVLLYRFKRR